MLSVLLLFHLAKITNAKKIPIESLFPDILRFSQSVQYNLCSETYSDCSCQESCIKFGTCCIDYLWDNKLNESLDLYKNRFLNTIKKQKHITCQPLLKLFMGENTFSEWFYMVAQCPKEVNKRLSDLCSKQGYNLPVFGSDKLIYKNRYCARCNRINSYDFLNITVDCLDDISEYSTSNITEKYNDCVFKLNKGNEINQYVNMCKENVSDDCTSETIWCKWCSSYSALISHDNKCYKNIHCLLETLQNVSIDWQPRFSLFDTCEPQGNLYSYSVLPRYSTLVSFAAVDTEDINRLCNQEEMYDANTDKCVDQIYCAFGYHLEEKNCVHDRNNDNFSDWINSSANILSIDQIKKLCARNIIYVDEYDHERNLNQHDPIFRNLLNTSFTRSQRKTSTIFITELYGRDYSRTFMNRLCAEPVVSYGDPRKLHISGNCTLYNNISRFSQSDYIILQANKTASTFKIVTCKRYHFSGRCSMRKIFNYTYFSNRSVYDFESGKLYEAEEYAPLDTGIGVCLQPGSSGLKWIHTTQYVESYITVIGCSLSIFGYIFTMATYIVIPELNTVPGKNIVCMCLMLFTCDLIILSTKSDNQYWCRISSYMLHFFALSAQMWSVVLAYDIWSTFSGKNIMRDTNKKVRFYYYCAFAWSIPIGLFLVIILLEKSNTLSLGYGANGVCWINNQMGLIFTYILPVFLSTTYASTTLFYTLFRIFRHKKKSGKLLKKSGGENSSLVKMAIKLVVLLGVIEMLGFFQIKSASDAGKIFNTIFQFLYSISRSFRGVFIFWLYVATDRVLSIYREIKRTRSLSSSRRSTISSFVRKKQTTSSETSTV